MTGKERKTAERLAKQICPLDELYRHREALIKGYAAAYEESWLRRLRAGQLNEVIRELEAERDRSAKLVSHYLEAIAALDATGTSVSLVEDMRRTLAEYEASND